MQLVPIAGHDFEFVRELYNEGLDMSATSVVQLDRDSLCLAALQAPTSVWRLAEVENRPVALLGLETVNQLDRTGEIFIAVAPEYRKQGFGTAASKLILDFAFVTLNLRRLSCPVLSISPSIKLLLKFGFKLEGVSKAARYRNGKYIDVLNYALVREG